MKDQKMKIPESNDVADHVPHIVLPEPGRINSKGKDTLSSPRSV